METGIHFSEKDQAKIRTCTLLITHRCNLNCVYCYESYKDNQKMSLEMAQSIIEKEFAAATQSGEFSHIEFDFMGGEPFLEFELMKAIMEWTWSRTWKISYHFFTTTNGTLFTPDVKKWVMAHRDKFRVGLSFDGTPSIQDLNRSQSSGKIDVDFFVELCPLQTIKLTASCDSIEHFAEGVIYLHSKNARVDAGLGHGMPWSEANFVEYEKQLEILIDYYLAHREIIPIMLLQPKMKYIFGNHPKTKYCGTGTQMITYDCDGVSYPCHLFTPLVLGDNRASELQRQIDFDDPDNYWDSRCDQCSLGAICGTCYGMNYKMTGKIYHREESFCRLFYITQKVYCKFESILLERKISEGEKLTEEDIAEAKGIVYFAEHSNPVLKQEKGGVL